MIYPAERLADLTDRMRSCGIEPKKMCILYTKTKTSVIGTRNINTGNAMSIYVVNSEHLIEFLNKIKWI